MSIILKDNESVDSFFSLGWLYENGLGVDRDYSTSFRYYKYDYRIKL